MFKNFKAVGTREGGQRTCKSFNKVAGICVCYRKENEVNIETAFELWGTHDEVNKIDKVKGSRGERLGHCSGSTSSVTSCLFTVRYVDDTYTSS